MPEKKTFLHFCIIFVLNLFLIPFGCLLFTASLWLIPMMLLKKYMGWNWLLDESIVVASVELFIVLNGIWFIAGWLSWEAQIDFIRMGFQKESYPTKIFSYSRPKNSTVSDALDIAVAA